MTSAVWAVVRSERAASATVGTRSAVPPVRFAVFPVLHALLVDAMVVAVETAAVISFHAFPPLELALGAMRCHLPSMFVDYCSRWVQRDPVSARGAQIPITRAVKRAIAVHPGGE